MLDQSRENIERHIKTHSERSDDDRAAVSVLETFLRSNGRINTAFANGQTMMGLSSLYLIRMYHDVLNKRFMSKSKGRGITAKVMGLLNIP